MLFKDWGKRPRSPNLVRVVKTPVGYVPYTQWKAEQEQIEIQRRMAASLSESYDVTQRIPTSLKDTYDFLQ
jgi:hypothetical protein